MKKCNFFNKTEIIIALLIVTLLGILSLSCNTFFMADDFAIKYDLKNRTIFEHCIQGYYNWDGRFLSIASFFQLYLLKYHQVELTTFIWSFCFLLSCGLMFFIINHDQKISFENSKQKIIFVLLFIVTGWLGAFKHFSETIYWATGGIYSLYLLFGVVWILLFLKIQKSEIKLLNKILFFIFSIIVGGLTQNLSVGLIALIVLSTLEKPFNFKINLFFMLGILIGLIFISIAPGNLERLKYFESSKQENIMFFRMLVNFLKIIYHYLLGNYFIVPIYVIFAIFFTVLVQKKLWYKFNLRFKIPTNRQDLIAIILFHKWLIIALSTIISFVIVPELATPRTEIFFIYFLEIYLLSTFLNFFKESSQSKLMNLNLSFVSICNICILIILITTNFFVISNFKKGIVLKSAFESREKIMTNSRNKTIHLQQIDSLSASDCYRFMDFVSLGSHKNDWIREAQENYFQVKIIVDK